MFTDAQCDPLETLKRHQPDSWVVAIVSRTDNKKTSRSEIRGEGRSFGHLSAIPNETFESHLNDDT